MRLRSFIFALSFNIRKITKTKITLIFLTYFIKYDENEKLHVLGTIEHSNEKLTLSCTNDLNPEFRS